MGFDEKLIGRLETWGHLRRLALSEPQIRARLYCAHLAYLSAQADRTGRLRSPESSSAHRDVRALPGRIEQSSAWALLKCARDVEVRDAP